MTVVWGSERGNGSQSLDATEFVLSGTNRATDYNRVVEQTHSMLRQPSEPTLALAVCACATTVLHSDDVVHEIKFVDEALPQLLDIPPTTTRKSTDWAVETDCFN